MASKEKKPLASSKAKQKSNNNASLASANDTKNKRVRSVGFQKRQIEWQRLISTAVVTGNSLPAKIEPGLPRKKIDNLVRQQKLKNAKTTKSAIVKAKKKVPLKTLKLTGACKIARAGKKIKKEPQDAEGPKVKVEAEAEDAKEAEGGKCPEEEVASSEVKVEGQAKTPKSLKNNVKANGKKKAETTPKVPKILKTPFKGSEPKVKANKSLAHGCRADVTEKCSYDLTIEEVIASSMLVLDLREGETKAAEEAEEDSKKKDGLRNGKLRQVANLGIRRRSCSNDQDEKPEVELNFPESRLVTQDAQVENNNNGEQSDEAGPILRSKKTKTRSVCLEDEDVQKSALEKTELVRKDKAGGTKMATEKGKCRRNSLDLETKKVESMEIGEGGPSKIDRMIEDIKLKIAQSIENKILGDKGLGMLGKNFQVKAEEEVVAPINDTKPGLDVNKEEEDKDKKSENMGKDEVREYSLPKVADTAKEIEKLVMGDVELVDARTDEKNNDSPPEVNSHDVVAEEYSLQKELAADNVFIPCAPPKDTEESLEETLDNAKKVETPDDAEQVETLDDDKKKVEPLDEVKKVLRKSPRTSTKTTPEKTKIVPKTSPEKVPVQEVVENVNDEDCALNDELLKTPENMEVDDPRWIVGDSGDIETLESITREVEKLVGMTSTSPTEEVESKVDDGAKEKVVPVKSVEEKLPQESLRLEEVPEDGCDGVNPDKMIKVENAKQELEDEKKSDEGKRVLRTREKHQQQKKKTPEEPEVKTPEEENVEASGQAVEESVQEAQVRTRRSREPKKKREEVQSSPKSRRSKKDTKKLEQQKEETLLDNEVAEINENQSTDNNSQNGCRGFSEPSTDKGAQVPEGRCKSENDVKNICSDKPFTPSENLRNEECKSNKSLEIMQKDLDEASTSGESSSSGLLKILETPEELAMKESILGVLGLQPSEKVSEQMRQRRLEQSTSGTLKTVIRVQKDKERGGEKKRSRSPLKMVLKQQGRGESGDGDSFDFYTIQKELGTSGLGDSSSGANRKFTTNHRYNSEDDTEESPSKDRHSIVIPEKSSSFSIHPGRLCADVCCYCFGKFGSLDTPMHLAQMKSDDRMKKILNVERHLTKDSCLCDACYRHVDRKAHVSPTNLQPKPQKQHRQLMVSKCSARDCKETSKHNVKRRWLAKIKGCLQNQVDIDWESSQHSSMSFCATHYPVIEKFLTCALCNRRLAKNQTHLLPAPETDELNQRLAQHRVPVPLTPGTYLCKLCRYFTTLLLKKDVDNMSSSTKTFYINYRKRVLHHRDIDALDNDDDEASKDKEKVLQKKPVKCNQSKICGSQKSSEHSGSSASEKSTPEPAVKHTARIRVSSSRNSNDAKNEEVPHNNHATTASNAQFLSIESTIEKLKKRKALDEKMKNCGTNPAPQSMEEVVEILAMDKEVTLTRLPKRSRTSNDITPVVQRLGANPSISVRTLFPGEEDMNLHANVDFGNVREVTPHGWEKCSTMIQYDLDTKVLWQELQRPYGNQSSFLRHLILLEKYYRSGDLVLAPNASRNAINYSTSVQNRLISFEGPEKMDEPIMEPIPDYSNLHRTSGGYVQERPAASSAGPKILSINRNVSLIKKPPPSLQRLNLPSTSSMSHINPSSKRKNDSPMPIYSTSTGGKVFKLSEPEYKRFQNLKKQKSLLADRATPSATKTQTTPSSVSSQAMQNIQFQKHLRMQQEMLSRQSRGDFEPLICDDMSAAAILANENQPTQNYLHNLNLPKSIQVTTAKPLVPLSIPMMPKIPKSLTVIPQTIAKPVDK